MMVSGGSYSQDCHGYLHVLLKSHGSIIPETALPVHLATGNECPAD